MSLNLPKHSADTASDASLAHPDIVFPPQSASRSSSSPSSSPGDAGSVGGHHPARIGDTFKSGRYRVLARLGSGHFSTVWLCFDSQRRVPDGSSGYLTGAAVAVKIQKSAERYTEAANDEILLLRGVRASDPTGKEPVVSLLDSFAHSGPNGRHICLVFDVLGVSLLSLIRRFRYRGVPMPLVRTVAHGILRGLSFLHDSAGIVHTDLKPENILMVPSDEEYATIHKQAALYARYLCDSKSRRTEETTSSQGEQGATRPCPAGVGGNAADNKLTKNQRKRAKAKAKKALQKQEPRNSSPDDEIEALLRESEKRPRRPDGSEHSGHVVEQLVTGNENAGVDQMQGERPVNLKDAWSHSDVGERGGGQAQTDGAGPSTDGTVAEGRVDGKSDPSNPGTSRDEVHCAGNVLGENDVELSEGDSSPRWTGGRFVLSDFMDTDNLFRRGKVRIIDLGNACWTSTTSTGVIQTRQYRSPEVITGGRFGASADMWSAACLFFELATGEFLFDPHGGRDYDRDEDHLAQMIELLGPIPRSVSSRGAYASELFNRSGELRHIRDLSFWALDLVLMEKYEFSSRMAKQFSGFLELMLKFDPSTRAPASECLRDKYFSIS